MSAAAFDAQERAGRTGTAAVYERSFGRLCAGTVPRLLSAAGVRAGSKVLDAGTGTGTVAAAALQLGRASRRPGERS